jgi:hypothetical protein
VFHGGKYLPIDAEANFDIARLDALRRYRADASREATRSLRELRLLRAEPPAESRNEPEPAPEPAPAAAVTRLVTRNEPERRPPITPVPANDPLPTAPPRAAAGREPPRRP